MADRVQREKEAYSSMDVFNASSKLQGRFWHVFQCPNSILLEKYFERIVAENTPDSRVLDYGCLYGDFHCVLSKYHPERIVGIDWALVPS